MITDIVLENFKCFRRVEISPKRVTCFVGANGTGKSSVLQAFGLLKQTVDGVSISWMVDSSAKSCELNWKGPIINCPSPGDLVWRLDHSNPRINLYGTEFQVESQQEFSCKVDILENRLDVREESTSKGVDAFRSTMTKLRIIPAIRGLARPTYKLGKEPTKDLSLLDGFVQQEGQTATNLCYSREATERISPLLKRVTGVGLQADTVPPQSVEIKSLSPSGPISVVLEGFGANSLIMLLLQLTSAEKGATVMIEEPEIHLHPRAQAELAEVLTEVALEEDKQVILTTHSEHITGRLLTLVAEGKLTPEDVAIYAFEKDEAGVCTAKDLRINENGTIEGSINDFFEVNLAEMNRFTQAQFTRLRSEE